MIPNHIHQYWDDAYSHQTDLKRFSDGDAGPMRKSLLKTLIDWREYHPDFTTHLWTTDKITSLARLYGHTLFADTILRCNSRSVRADLVMLFLLETIGGYWIDSSIRPQGAVLYHDGNHDLVRIKVGDVIEDRIFFGARPGLLFILKALDKVMIGVHRPAERVSAAMALDMINRDNLRILTLDGHAVWGKLMERRQEDRESKHQEEFEASSSPNLGYVDNYFRAMTVAARCHDAW